jgi:predicted transcriptional regulator
LSRTRFLFLPIQPQWALAILDGTKKYELRTRRPAIQPGDVVVLYATSPLRAVVGSFIAGEVISGTPSEVWKAVGGKIASPRSSYFTAFGAREVVHAIPVKKPRRIDPYTPAFKVGQGWRFLDGRNHALHRRVIARIDASR